MIYALFFYHFFNSKLFLIYFLQFIFIKSSNNLFSIKIINNICPRRSIFNFFNHKNFFRPIWSITFCKNIFMLWYSPILNWGSLSLISLLEPIYVFFFTSTSFILILLWYLLLYLLTASSNLSIYTFLTLKSCVYKFYF